LFYGPHFDYVDPETGILHEGYLSHPLNILKVYEGGLASHGGAIGILIAMWLYSRKTKESLLWICDKLVVVVPLAAMFIRFGNLMNSEIIGMPTTLPWGFVFEQNDTDIINLKALGIPIPARHPSQLYEAIFCLGLFVLMYWLWKNKRNSFGPGYMFGLLCVLLFTERFFVEFTKENQEAFEDHMLFNMGQILSIPLILAGAFFMWRASKKKRAEQIT
jgi:prolipoprotein diacylglyceryl transferase